MVQDLGTYRDREKRLYFDDQEVVTFYWTLHIHARRVKLFEHYKVFIQIDIFHKDIRKLYMYLSKGKTQFNTFYFIQLP